MLPARRWRLAALVLLWKTKSLNPLLSLPLPFGPGVMVFEALGQVSSGLHCHSGTSFLKPCFLIRSIFFFFFKCIVFLSIPWCLQPKMKGRECFPVVDLEGVKSQMFG